MGERSLRRCVPPVQRERMRAVLPAHVVLTGAIRPARAQTRILNPIRDYTPPELLTLLVTDLGLLTPSAVSDMLITLHTR